jgi:hypothetical protein
MIQLSGVSRTFDGRSGRVEALRGIVSSSPYSAAPVAASPRCCA